MYPPSPTSHLEIWEFTASNIRHKSEGYCEISSETPLHKLFSYFQASQLSVYSFQGTYNRAVFQPTFQGGIILQFTSLRRHLAGQYFSFQPTFQEDIFLQFTSLKRHLAGVFSRLSGRHFPSVYSFDETSSSVIIQQTFLGAIFLQFTSSRRHLAWWYFSFQPTFQGGISFSLLFWGDI